MHLPTRHTPPSVRYRNPFLPPLLHAPPRPANKQSHSRTAHGGESIRRCTSSFGVSVSFDPVVEPADTGVTPSPDFWGTVSNTWASRRPLLEDCEILSTCRRCRLCPASARLGPSIEREVPRSRHGLRASGAGLRATMEA